MSGTPAAGGAAAPAPVPCAPAAPAARFRRHPETRRFVYEFNDRPVYEWEQSLTECVLYIPAPPAPVRVTIRPQHLTVGLRDGGGGGGGAAAFIDEDTWDTVDVQESTWTVEEDTIVVYLQKARKALMWEALLKGRILQLPRGEAAQQDGAESAAVVSTAAQLDPFQLEEVQREIMLQRWQEQYPGMDFRDADFNGQVPNPRTFMGGVQHE